MKRWALFFSFFLLVLAISFFSFLFCKRTSLLEAAVVRGTSLSCSIGKMSIGLKQQTLEQITCTLPDQSKITIDSLTIAYPLHKLLFWSLNPFQQQLDTGKWEINGVNFQVVSKSINFSQSGWKEWLKQVSAVQTGSLNILSLELHDVRALVRNDMLAGAILEPPLFSTAVVLSKEPLSTQATLSRIVSTLLHEISYILGLPLLAPDQNSGQNTPGV